jgi:hypothetical protein
LPSNGPRFTGANRDATSERPRRTVKQRLASGATAELDDGHLRRSTPVDVQEKNNADQETTHRDAERSDELDEPRSDRSVDFQRTETGQVHHESKRGTCCTELYDSYTPLPEVRRCDEDRNDLDQNSRDHYGERDPPKRELRFHRAFVVQRPAVHRREPRAMTWALATQ